MKKTIFFSLILIIFSVPACAKTETQLEDKITLESAIEQYENTIDLCTAEGKNRTLPDESTLKKISKIDIKKVKDYILYRSDINYKICMLKNGAAPLEYFVALSTDKAKSSAVRKRARLISEEIVSSHIIDKVNNISNLTSEEMLQLKSIGYLNTSFDAVKTYDALKSYNSQKID